MWAVAAVGCVLTGLLSGHGAYQVAIDRGGPVLGFLAAITVLAGAPPWAVATASALAAVTAQAAKRASGSMRTKSWESERRWWWLRGGRRSRLAPTGLVVVGSG